MPIGHRIEPAVQHIIARLADNGFEAYVVGGAVRDLLLGIEPKDYDIATSASPEEVRDVFGRRRARIIGRRFRLAHVYGKKGFYEVSTFRREPTPAERRGREEDDGVMIWRDNVYGSLEEDARRRDFTVNALYYDPVGERGIIDFVDGVNDLDAARVRAIGTPEVRLEEDPVRMLRALKLVGQYGFSVEERLGQAIRDLSPRIADASRARLFEELLKVFSRSSTHATFQACLDHGFLRDFWPNLADLWETPSGRFLQELLRSRDRHIAGNDDYSKAKALAVATVALPSVARALGCPELRNGFWHFVAGMEYECRHTIQDFLQPFPVSRFFMARAREMIMLLPRLHKGVQQQRVMRHPEYKYARLLFLALIDVCGWDPALLAPWPTLAPAPDGGSRRSRRHPRRRSRPRRRSGGPSGGP